MKRLHVVCVYPIMEQKYNRWVIYYSGDYSVSYSRSPCRVMYYDGEHRRVELSNGQRMWVLKHHLFRTSNEASDASIAARGVNAWS